MFPKRGIRDSAFSKLSAPNLYLFLTFTIRSVGAKRVARWLPDATGGRGGEEEGGEGGIRTPRSYSGASNLPTSNPPKVA